jgi:proline racemase
VARDDAGGDDGFMKTICTSVDFHTAGEPFRIVAEPPVEIPGTSVAERRELKAVWSPRESRCGRAGVR